MPPLQIIVLSFAIVVNAMIFLLLSTQSWRTVVNRYFIVAVACVILWATGLLLLITNQNEGVIDLARTMYLIAPMYIMLFLSFFAGIFPSENGKTFTLPNTLLAALTIPFSAYIFYHPADFIVAVHSLDGVNKIEYGFWWHFLYVLYFIVAFLITFSIFRVHAKRTTGFQRQQVVYVFVGTLLVALVSLITNLTLPLAGIDALTWIGPSSTLFYVVSIAISIVRYQLFDIKLAVVRSITYSSVLITLSLVYYGLVYILSTFVIGNQLSSALYANPIAIAMAFLLAFMFQPIKRFYDKFTNDIFYRNTYKSEDFFANLSTLLTSTTDLRGLLSRAANEIAETFKSEQVLFFLYYETAFARHLSVGTKGHAKLPLYDAKILDSYAAAFDDPVLLTERMPAESAVYRMLKSHKISIVVPLRQADLTTGYVLIGDRLTGRYTKRDLDILSAIGNELVIAIQNALSLHEVKELNATLQQRIDVATKELRSSNAQLKHLDETKNEFMSMASHQLRTPLTSVKGYISMVLDGDAGAVTEQQRPLLLEAFNSSERMVRLIADFLDVSRLQTGKFAIEKEPCDIKTLVREETDTLTIVAKSHNLKLKVEITDQPLPVTIDGSKVRQVIMNFVDNAIYYSRANSTIIVRLQKVKDTLAFTVVDTGIGVPPADQEKLFTKFFRASNARKQRPDGTGVGLYLARRIVHGHGGSIIFSSTEGKGSTFGFQLPLDLPAKK